MDHLSWQIGKITVTKVLEVEVVDEGHLIPQASSEELRKIPWLFPDFCTPEANLKFSVHALLVQTPTHRFVIDTCVGNDKKRKMALFSHLSGDFLKQLAALGWTRESVDGVVCTHLHIDHVGWNTMLEGDVWVPTFPNAHYFTSEDEFDHWRGEVEYAREGKTDRQGVEDAEELEEIWLDSVQPIVDAKLHQSVPMNAELVPGIRLIPTPGHTPGHVSVVLESDGDTAIITGDLIHHPCQVARADWAFFSDYDQDAAQQTRSAFIDSVVDNGTLVIGTHFASPTAGRVVSDGAKYKFVSG